MIDHITEDVQVGLAVIDRRDLNGRDEADAQLLGRGGGFRDAIDRVVIADGQQFNAVGRRRGDDLAGGERAIGLARVALQVECRVGLSFTGAAEYPLADPRRQGEGTDSEGSPEGPGSIRIPPEGQGSGGAVPRPSVRLMPATAAA